MPGLWCAKVNRDYTSMLAWLLMVKAPTLRTSECLKGTLTLDT